jgi:hypothetical protein
MDFAVNSPVSSSRSPFTSTSTPTRTSSGLNRSSDRIVLEVQENDWSRVMRWPSISHSDGDVTVVT